MAHFHIWLLRNYYGQIHILNLLFYEPRRNIFQISLTPQEAINLILKRLHISKHRALLFK